MSDEKKSKNIFKKIGRLFSSVIAELKKVIWPTKEKLIQTCAVVLVVIGIAIVALTGISKGAGYLLKKVGFYEQAPAKVTTVATDSSSTLESSATETEAAEISEEATVSSAQ
ncbi:MAG: preprotein translocase subunit SecE [Clostridiaceae bacterium]|nr:preprotein translocase subunit SecE [Clostridiaceae bacterium]